MVDCAACDGAVVPCSMIDSIEPGGFLLTFVLYNFFEGGEPGVLDLSCSRNVTVSAYLLLVTDSRV